MHRQQLVDALTDPASRTTEANIQAAIRDLLLHGGLDLADGQLVDLEAPSGTGRIDIEVGSTVIEVKRTLDRTGAEDRALEQLVGYVAERQAEHGRRYVGVLTDGLRWSAWHLPPDTADLQCVHRFELSRGSGLSDLDDLVVWLDGLLATAQHVPPSPREVARRLGAGSTATRLDLATLHGLYERAADKPDVALKRELWSRLLTVASGTAVDETDNTRLFLEHTYLVILADVIAHAVIGYDVRHLDPDELLRGRLFTAAGVYGVVEQDFFDWVGDVDRGLTWIRQLTERIGRFDWTDVDHDVLKVLYQSVIDPETRHQLGEHYTPDWLARDIVEAVVDDPSSQRVLDPACGSGTFIFWAVRAALEAADRAGVGTRTAITDVTSRIYGIDVHPVAVTLARVTYLLALGHDRLTGDRDAFHVPVYLGDSVQFEQSEGQLFNSSGFVVHTADGRELFDRQLTFPDRVVDDVATFDQLIVEMTELACDRAPGSRRPDIGPLLARHGIHPDDKATLRETFKALCDLNDDGRNHIWGYYLRNLARPRWLSRPGHRVDRVVGNPPWLSYRFMPGDMQTKFRKLAETRALWAGGQVATHQDLSALFVVRATELYLAPGGKFGMVVPYATLSRQAYEGFRRGRWAPARHLEGEGNYTLAKFERAWDLVDVQPDIFPVPSAVVFGQRSNDGEYAALPRTVVKRSGRQPEEPTDTSGLDELDAPLVTLPSRDDDWSAYHSRFYQGAIITPKVLTVVERVQAGPLGTAGARTPIRTLPSMHEPWRDIAPIDARIEDRFLWNYHLGATVLPFRLQPPQLAVIPLVDDSMLEPDDPGLQRWPGLADWYRRASRHWEDHKAASAPDTLAQQLDYRRKVTRQLPTLDRPRVVYSTSGMTLTAAVVVDPNALVESSLYWCACSSQEEAHYLAAILNSPVITERVRPLQSIGAFGPRHFHKWVWALPIPHFEKGVELHRRLAEVGGRAAGLAAEVDVEGVPYPRNRGTVRDALRKFGLMSDLDAMVDTLLLETAETQREG